MRLAAAGRSPLLRLLLLLPVLLTPFQNLASAFTLPDQAARALAYRDATRTRSPAWAEMARAWTCPLAAPSAPGTPPPPPTTTTCDICGDDWQGNWMHISCRGATRGWGESGDGARDGVINSLHTTSVNLDGALPRELCAFNRLRQLDLGGRQGAGRFVGPIEPWVVTCFPEVEELDLSMLRLTGTLPREVAMGPAEKTLSELKVEGNRLVGLIPAEIGNMTRLRRLQLEYNDFSGEIPQTFARPEFQAQLTELHLASNRLEGNLNALSKVRLFTATVHENPGLCGMVPAGVRYAAGYDPKGTRLGEPC
jgi:hypothetical protein